MSATVEIKQLGVQDAIRAASRYFQEVFPPGKTNSPSRITVEEVEKSQDNKFWLVTLGYDEVPRRNPHLPDYLNVPLRKLKVFKVDAKTGQVVAMKIHSAG